MYIKQRKKFGDKLNMRLEKLAISKVRGLLCLFVGIIYCDVKLPKP